MGVEWTFRPGRVKMVRVSEFYDASGSLKWFCDTPGCGSSFFQRPFAEWECNGCGVAPPLRVSLGRRVELLTEAVAR